MKSMKYIIVSIVFLFTLLNKSVGQFASIDTEFEIKEKDIKKKKKEGYA